MNMIKMFDEQIRKQKILLPVAYYTPHLQGDNPNVVNENFRRGGVSIKATSNKGLKKPNQRCHKAYINMIPTRQESHNARIPQSITSFFSKKLHWQDLYQKLILAKALIDWRQIIPFSAWTRTQWPLNHQNDWREIILCSTGEPIKSGAQRQYSS